MVFRTVGVFLRTLRYCWLFRVFFSRRAIGIREHLKKIDKETFLDLFTYNLCDQVSLIVNMLQRALAKEQKQQHNNFANGWSDHRILFITITHYRQRYVP